MIGWILYSKFIHLGPIITPSRSPVRIKIVNERPVDDFDWSQCQISRAFHWLHWFKLKVLQRLNYTLTCTSKFIQWSVWPASRISPNETSIPFCTWWNPFSRLAISRLSADCDLLVDIFLTSQNGTYNTMKLVKSRYPISLSVGKF